MGFWNLHSQYIWTVRAGSSVTTEVCLMDRPYKQAMICDDHPCYHIGLDQYEDDREYQVA